MERRIVIYEQASGRRPFQDWLRSLRDKHTAARILQRIERAAAGNVGGCKSVGGGVFELRCDFGPGYRVYFAYLGDTLLVILLGGDKSSQASDIRRACDHLRDYQKGMRR